MIFFSYVLDYFVSAYLLEVVKVEFKLQTKYLFLLSLVCLHLRMYNINERQIMAIW